MLGIFLTVSLSLAAVAVDGDTIIIGKEHIRIANIDAPEIGHAKCDAELRLGQVAKRRMQALLEGGKVRVRPGDPKDGRTKDRFGRTLATVTIDGKDVGEIMIAEGLVRPWEGKRRSWCD